MELFYLLDLHLHKIWLKHERYQDLSILCKIGDDIIFSLKQEEYIPPCEDGSLTINTGRILLLPLTVSSLSRRQFPEKSLSIEILENEDQDIESSILTTFPEAHIRTHIPWEINVPQDAIKNKNQNNEYIHESVRKTYQLYNDKDGSRIGYIDLDIRLLCLGNNIWPNFRKMSRLRSAGLSGSDRSPIISEPQTTEDERWFTQTEDEGSVFLGRDSATLLVKLKDAQDAETEETVGLGRDSSPESQKDMKERLSNMLLGYMQHQDLVPDEKDITVMNVCNTKSCPNPPRDRYDAGIHSCSEIFGPGSNRSSFCRKSKRKREFPHMLPCTRRTCLARSPCRPAPCGPCLPDLWTPGTCCPIPGKVCPECGGFSASGRTCQDIKLERLKNTQVERMRKSRTKKQRTIYDCLKVCPSSTITSRKVPYPGTCYPHGVPDDGGGSCIVQDGPNVQPKIPRGPIRVPFGAGREEPIRRPKVKIEQPAKGAYVYTAGERQPLSSHARHQFCDEVERNKKIPANMGWLWSHRPIAGVRKLPDDWRPGFINEEIKILVDERRRRQQSAKASSNAKQNVPKEDEGETSDVYMLFVQPPNSSKLLIDGVVSHVHFDDQNFQKIVDLASIDPEIQREKDEKCIQELQNGIGAICRAICNSAVEDLMSNNEDICNNNNRLDDSTE